MLYKKNYKNAPSLFRTNLIDPIGTPGWDTAYWAYHQFGWYNNNVYDACIRVNSNYPFIPTSLSQSTYDSYLLYPGQSYDTSNIGTTTLH